MSQWGIFNGGQEVTDPACLTVFITNKGSLARENSKFPTLVREPSSFIPTYSFLLVHHGPKRVQIDLASGWDVRKKMVALATEH